MSFEKKKILAVWGYYRKDWISLFEKTTDDFEYTYLFWVYPEQEKNAAPNNASVIYWSDYKSAFHLLDLVQPYKVVFMSIDNLHTIALNYACRKRKMPTYVLQHGMYHPLANYQQLERLKQGKVPTVAVPSDKKKAARIQNFLLRFYINTTRFDPFAFYFLLRFYFFKLRTTELNTLLKTQGLFRQAGAYIVYTKTNAELYAHRDGVPERKMLEIGFPLVDEFVAASGRVAIAEPYYVLIDQPLAESNRENRRTILDYNQVNNFYTRLATLAASRGKRLKIKLHPFNYNSSYFAEHPTIDYIRETDTVTLIMNSEGIFGYCSSLTIAAMLFKPHCLFKVEGFTHLQDRLLQWGLTPVLSYHSFTDQEVSMTMMDKQHPNYKSFLDEFIKNSDGLAWKRYAQILKG